MQRFLSCNSCLFVNWEEKTHISHIKRVIVRIRHSLHEGVRCSHSWCHVRHVYMLDDVIKLSPDDDTRCMIGKIALIPTSFHSGCKQTVKQALTIFCLFVFCFFPDRLIADRIILSAFACGERKWYHNYCETSFLSPLGEKKHELKAAFFAPSATCLMQIFISSSSQDVFINKQPAQTPCLTPCWPVKVFLAVFATFTRCCICCCWCVCN